VRSIVANVALMYGILVVVNLPAPLLGLRFEDSTPQERLWFEPPGWAIGLAWFVLFALLGLARWSLEKASGPDAGRLVVALAILCSTYAYYTLGLAKLTGVSALWYGLWGNLVVVACALLVAWRVAAVSPTAAVAVLPVAAWTAFATAIVIGRVRAQALL
jgi:tryptophan-rich sensory protein